ncbi:hypothetical protein E4U24_006616 [Claviceps purpurea]|nr:hypothetical protein E4U11_006965 [Claviceps purpurea]KAG6240014.1 hypothetical protein E4U24_006616 [Claviceps purpurea]KAG6260959.1 hypothetical protein E4U49_004358 [Claviceps purpurea]
MKSMAFFRFAISCFLARWALVSALVVSEPTTGVFVPSWDVAIEPGQDNKIVVNGTIQQVDSYMEAHYPGWSAKMANFPSSHSAPAKRAPDWRKLKDFNCNRLLHRGSTRAIVDGINYLRSISKDRHPRNGPGPRSCGRVSCSWDAVIVWCNDGDEPKTLDSFSDIAAGAQLIVKICALNGDVPLVSGQMWFVGNWSVIAGKWSCDDEWELPSTGH